jgi:replicative DNA helicase
MSSKPEHFYSESHRRIFEACLALAEQRQPIDIIAVGTVLR